MSDQVRDDRKLPHYWIENQVYELYAPQIGVYGLAVYNALCYYANMKGECFPSIKTIAKHLDCGERNVWTAISKLEAAGLIQRQKRYRKDGMQTSNLYIINAMQNMHTRSAKYAHEQESVNNKESTATPSKSKATYFPVGNYSYEDTE